jgi:hypothetical protein
VGVVFGRIALDDDLPAGNGQIDAQMVDPAFTLAAGARFDDDAAAHDPREKPLEALGALADMGFDGRRGGHVTENDL